MMSETIASTRMATGHTDLHIIDGAISQIALPLVLGHEITGESEELGPVLVYSCAPQREA